MAEDVTEAERIARENAARVATAYDMGYQQALADVLVAWDQSGPKAALALVEKGRQ